MGRDLPLTVTEQVRCACLCLHVQRAARALARRFDQALRPYGLTNGQFSLLMSLNRATPPCISDLAPLLGMDRSTITANLKPLARRQLVEILVDSADRRSRRLQLTPAGRDLLVRVLPIWRDLHAQIEAQLPSHDPARLRTDLSALG